MEEVFKEKFLVTDGECSINISKTAYRALYIAKILSSKPMTKEEIIAALKNNSITQSSSSFDSFRLSLNTLKALGCEFIRPSVANNYTYFLSKCPFAFDLKKSEVDLLNTCRQNLAFFNDWKLLIKLNLLYKKLAKISGNEEIENLFIGKEPLKDVQIDVLNDLLKYVRLKKTVDIEYSSGSSKNSEITIRLADLRYENGHLYFCGYIPKYKEYAYLDVANLKKIKKIYFDDEIQFEPLTEAKYKLYKPLADEFIPTVDEEIIEKNADFIIVKANVISKFVFLQRILMYGNQCELLSPNDLRQELIKKLLNLKERYSNG